MYKYTRLEVSAVRAVRHEADDLRDEIRVDAVKGRLSQSSPVSAVTE